MFPWKISKILRAADPKNTCNQQAAAFFLQYAQKKSHSNLNSHRYKTSKIFSLLKEFILWNTVVQTRIFKMDVAFSFISTIFPKQYSQNNLEKKILSFIHYPLYEYFTCHGVKVGPGPRDLGPRDPPQSLKVGRETPLKFKSGSPEPSSRIKSGTLGPPSKFKSGTNPHHICLTNSFFSEYFIVFLLIYFCFFLIRYKKI